jgi:hypothetical protein
MRIQFTILTLVSLAAHSPTLGAKENPRIYRSAYFLGRGDTGIATADEQEAIFYNPAGIAAGKGIFKKIVFASPEFEVSRSTKDLVRQLAVEKADTITTAQNHVGKPDHVSFSNFSGVILRRVAVGAFVSSQNDVLVAKSVDAGGLEYLNFSSSQNVGATFTLAEKFFGDSLLIGTTGKYIKRGQAEVNVDVSEADSIKSKKASDFVGLASGTGADVGAQYHIKQNMLKWSFGAVVENVGTTKMVPDDNPEFADSTIVSDLKQTVNAGFALESRTHLSYFRLLVDGRDLTSAYEKDEYKKAHIGAELSMADLLGFTGGINQGYATGGVFLDLHFMRVDIGAYTEEVGEWAGHRPDTRYYFRLLAGL